MTYPIGQRADATGAVGATVGRSAALVDVDPRLPVRLLTGPRESGKTSLIRHVMAHPDGVRRAHIVSDHRLFDALPAAAARPDDRTAILENGSVCFGMHGSDVVEALNRLQLCKLGLAEVELDYDEIIVEVPADISPLVIVYQLQTDTRLALTFRFDAIAALVDAAAERAHLGRESPNAPAIGRADLLILNKSNLLSPGDADAVRSEVASINPFATMLTARHGAVSASRLMSSDSLEGPGHEAAPPDGVALLPPLGIEGPAKAAISGLVNNPMNSARSNASASTSPVRAARIRLAGNADIFRVAATVAKIAERAGADLYRLRCVTSNPRTEHPVVFQYVDGAFIAPSWGEPGPARETRLTVVGRGFEPREILADVAACLWDPAAIARGAYTPF